MPLGDPEIDLEVERLNGRQRGVIKVVVIQAKDLRSYDTLTGTQDVGWMSLQHSFPQPAQRSVAR